jgi:hypothetical protein
MQSFCHLATEMPRDMEGQRGQRAVKSYILRSLLVGFLDGCHDFSLIVVDMIYILTEDAYIPCVGIYLMPVIQASKGEKNKFPHYQSRFIAMHGSFHLTCTE